MCAPMRVYPAACASLVGGAALFETIGQRADVADDDAHRTSGLHRADADRRAAGDDVARLQHHVVRNEARQLRWWKDDIGDRIVLPLLVVEDGLDISVDGSMPVAITGPNTPKVSKLLARVHCAKPGSLAMISIAVTSLMQV